MGLYRDFKRRWFRVQQESLDNQAMALGRIEARQIKGKVLDSLREAEFKVFSQRGEDGIIQALIQRVSIENEIFVEFGVGDYRESNTRFLACSNRWAGVILDGGDAHVRYVAKESFLSEYARLRARSAFITRDNINQLLEEEGLGGDIGLLSVDIDGMDYWVFDAIDQVQPRIVVAEYNALWGPQLSVTLPYDEAFRLGNPSYFGASLKALSQAAAKKRLALVGCESGGVNAFFVREDLLGELKALTPEQAFVPRRFGGGLDGEGKFGWGVDAGPALDSMADLTLVDPATGQSQSVAQWFGR